MIIQDKKNQIDYIPYYTYVITKVTTPNEPYICVSKNGIEYHKQVSDNVWMLFDEIYDLNWK